MPLYDYFCECGVVTEVRAGYDVERLPCPACGRLARRQAVYRISLALSALPTQAGRHSDTRKQRQRYRDYREASQEIDYTYSRRENDVGHAVEAPNYYAIAKERVAKLRGAGVKSLDEVRR